MSNDGKWYYLYTSWGSLLRPNNVLEPTQKEPNRNVWTADSKEEAEKEFVERVKVHAEKIMIEAQSLTNNNKLKQRLRKYGRGDVADKLEDMNNYIDTLRKSLCKISGT